MIKLYGMGSPNVVKIYIALEEARPALRGRARRCVHRQTVRRRNS